MTEFRPLARRRGSFRTLAKSRRFLIRYIDKVSRPKQTRAGLSKDSAGYVSILADIPVVE
jgi:hypothetical protein